MAPSRPHAAELVDASVSYIDCAAQLSDPFLRGCRNEVQRSTFAKLRAFDPASVEAQQAGQITSNNPRVGKLVAALTALEYICTCLR